MHSLLNFFKNYFLRIVFVNRLNKSILWGLIFSFAPTISLGEVPEKITEAVSREKGCLGCHEGIEEIREQGSMMLMQTKIIGKVNGDPNGCVTCHGGNPKGLTAIESHQGAPKNLANGIGPKTFYPDPGSIWIADRTCGQCHVGYPYRMERGLMNTEAGKIQGNLHTWGIEEVQNHKVPWGNYDI